MSNLRTGRRRYYDAFSHFYDWFVKLHSRGHRTENREFLVDSAGLDGKPGPRILDVCCGTGSVILSFKERFPNILAVGYDFSHGMLLRAHEKGESRSLILIEGDAATLPFDDDTFDVVSCSHALYELKGPARKAVLLEMRRVVKPDGTVLIMEHEVPTSPLVKLLFYIRLLTMGPDDFREFLKQGVAPFRQVFSDVTLSHTKSGKSRLLTCRK
jgi:ubiquinone/menaquinone biosynthesis C-methylase UbiE